MGSQRLLDVPGVLDLPQSAIDGRWSDSAGALGGGDAGAAQPLSMLHIHTVEGKKKKIPFSVPSPSRNFLYFSKFIF